MIEISDLHMSYGPVKAVDGLSLNVPQGEFFALLGPNAAGKTTTIKVLTGLLSPDQGEVEVCGVNIREQPEEAKALMGYVPDVAVFFDKLTPVEFMRFTADLFCMDPAYAGRRTGELFEQFALDDYARERVENLSHGTRQRLAITSALLHDPKVIVIDEPMVGLDPIHVRAVKDEFRRRADDGVTILMSTHLLNIAEELADRIGVMAEGQIRAMGTAAELKADIGGRARDLEEVFLDLVGANSEVAEGDAA